MGRWVNLGKGGGTCKGEPGDYSAPPTHPSAPCLPTFPQAIGWSITLLLIILAFLLRCLRPCFDQTAFLQRRYWSNYVDLEQKLFDETCCEHARDLAHRCVLHFFHSMQSEMRARGLRRPAGDAQHQPLDLPEPPDSKPHLRAVSSPDQVDHLLSTWYSSKPPLGLVGAPGKWRGGLSL